jgi:hypothetical protein
MQDLGTDPAGSAQFWSMALPFSLVSPLMGQTLGGPRRLNWRCTAHCWQLRLAVLFQDLTCAERPRTSSPYSQSLDPCTLSLVDPHCRRASLTRKQPLRLEWRDKSFGRRWESRPHLANFFFLRGPNAGQTLDARVWITPSPQAQ